MSKLSAAAVSVVHRKRELRSPKTGKKYLVCNKKETTEKKFFSYHNTINNNTLLVVMYTSLLLCCSRKTIFRILYNSIFLQLTALP